VQTVEGNSPPVDLVREEYETKAISDRALAKKVGISDTALRKRARKGGWVKFCDIKPNLQPHPKPESTTRRPNLNGMTKAVTAATTGQLTELGRELILELMEELKFLNRHADVLSEIVEAHFNGEKDGTVKYKLQKALDHETRTKSSAALAGALQKLQDAGPGKKEERQDNAERSSSSGLYAAPSAPKLTH
jgi:DNA-binding PadR family transcriptional regulator